MDEDKYHHRVEVKQQQVKRAILRLYHTAIRHGVTDYSFIGAIGRAAKEAIETINPNLQCTIVLKTRK